MDPLIVSNQQSNRIVPGFWSSPDISFAIIDQLCTFHFSKFCSGIFALELKMSSIEPPFRPREKLFEKQKYFQNIHKHTYLKGPYDKITSVAIPFALAASSLYLIGRGIYNMSHGIGKKE